MRGNPSPSLFWTSYEYGPLAWSRTNYPTSLKVGTSANPRGILLPVRARMAALSWFCSWPQTSAPLRRTSSRTVFTWRCRILDTGTQPNLEVGKRYIMHALPPSSENVPDIVLASSSSSLLIVFSMVESCSQCTHRVLESSTGRNACFPYQISRNLILLSL